MSDDFDPYYLWFGIPPERQPANHYELLGLRAFETKPEVIDNAAELRLGHLRRQLSGPHAEHARRLTAEVHAARKSLLVPESRAAYDAQLAATGGTAPAAQPANAVAPLPDLSPAAFQKAAAAPTRVAAPAGVTAGVSAVLPQALPSAPRPTATTEEAASVDDDKPRVSRGKLYLVGATALFMLVAIAGVWMVGPWLASLNRTPAPTTNASSEPAGGAVDDSPAPPAWTVQQQGADGHFTLKASQAVVQGTTASYEGGEIDAIVNLSSPDDLVRWNLQVQRPGVFVVHVTYARQPDTVADFTIRSGDQANHCRAHSTGDWKEYRTDYFGALKFAKRGPHTVTLQTEYSAGLNVMHIKEMQIKLKLPARAKR